MSKQFAIGNSVVYTGEQRFPYFYPKTGTIGTVVKVCNDGITLVQWPEGSIGFTNNRSYVANSNIKRRTINE